MLNAQNSISLKYLIIIKINLNKNKFEILKNSVIFSKLKLHQFSYAHNIKINFYLVLYKKLDSKNHYQI